MGINVACVMVTLSSFHLPASLLACSEDCGEYHPCSSLRFQPIFPTSVLPVLLSSPS